MNYNNLIKSLINGEKEATSSEMAKKRYLSMHKYRFDFTLDIVSKLVPDKEASVLDVGRSFFSYMLAGYYQNVTTIGFSLKQDKGGHREPNANTTLSHIVFDLNKSKDLEYWPKPEKQFDIIIYAETLEHIYTAPEFSLMMLSSLLSKNGKLIISTPNAAAFHKRIRLLLGNNPYEKIRYYEKNPGHFREYTMKEMINMCETSGLVVEQTIHKKLSNLNPFKSLKALKFLPLKPFEYVPVFKDQLFLVASRK